MKTRLRSAGLVALATLILAMPARAQLVTLYTVEYLEDFSGYTLGTYGPFQAPNAASNLIFGNTPASGAPVSEVVVEQHVLHPGESVPLPHYADGTVANEGEVFWTVHLWRATFGKGPGGVNGRTDDYRPASPTTAGDLVQAGFSGRTYGGGNGLLSPYTFPSNVATNVDVMVTVIAVRSGTPTPTRASTWGDVKARFRQPRP